MRNSTNRIGGLMALLLVVASVAPAGSAASTPNAGAVPRVHGRFDGGWRFHMGDAPGAQAPAFNDSRWHEVDLPHDWSVEDLPPSPEADLPAIASVPGTWRFHAGDDPAWKARDFDDSAWQDVRLPGHWSDMGLRAENAWGWYRRRIAVPPALRGKAVLLLLGKVDDVDETFVNGVRVGGLGAFPPAYVTAWTRARHYRVPAGFLRCDGTDVVAVRDYNGQADAGIYEAAPASLRSGPFDLDSPNGAAQGYTLGGVGWYRKRFTLPPAWKGRRIGVTFDGVYMNAAVWFNGHRLGVHPYGYTTFRFDLTPWARFGKDANVLSVRVDSTGRTSRWYSGSGIYRHVWLTATGPVRVAPWGVSVTTPAVSPQRATVRVSTTLENGRAIPQRVTVETRVEPSGDEASVTQVLPAGGSRAALQEIAIRHPALWSPERPALYRLVTTVRAGGRVVDRERTPFGIRSVSVSAARGFLLNGKPLKLRGGCLHHDNGCLGARAFDRAEERKVELLKRAGFNAIRTSHNPPSPALLDACDRLGVLVIDEAFDCWQAGKNEADYARFFQDWWRRDVDSWILRDRNHPSVVFWSIGNEIPGQPTPQAASIAAQIAARVRGLDPTRPVTQAAYDGETKDLGVFASLDVCGYNYMPDHYIPDHEAHPDRVMVGTESFPGACFDAWMPVVDHPYVIGDFVWTAFDYIGEAGLGHADGTAGGTPDPRPFTVSNCGDFDLCGFRRPPSYYRSAVWNTGPVVSAFVEPIGPDGRTSAVGGWNWGWVDERPSWTWPGREGKPVRVRVYSSAPKVRLMVNGRDLGVKPAGRAARYMATWDVPYAPGRIDAMALDTGGRTLGRWTLRTAGKPAALRLVADRKVLAADGQDLSYVTVEVVDANGIVDPNASAAVRFRLRGPGKIAGAGNGDPRSTESFQGGSRAAYRGRCLVVVQAGRTAGDMTLTASADGLKTATVSLRAGKERD